jgi:uncharacterized membrane protein YuzA (DUF378 family)
MSLDKTTTCHTAPELMDQALKHDTQQEQQVIRKVSGRLIWFLFILFVFSFLDRINIGFAGLTMAKSLNLTATMFGFAATIFYITYVLCGIPSNIMLSRIGARRWMAGIMVAWGLPPPPPCLPMTPPACTSCARWWALPKPVSCPACWSTSPCGFPVYRARANALFMIAMPVTAALGSVVSGYLLEMDGIWQLAGWQWLFLVEGLPSAVLGVVVWFYLDDSPAKAKWLSAEEKRCLQTCWTPKHTSQHSNIRRNARTAAAHGAEIRLCLFLSGQHPEHGEYLGAANRQKLQCRQQQCHHRHPGRHSAAGHHFADAVVGRAFRPHPGAQMAHRAAHAVCRCRLAADRLCR